MAEPTNYLILTLSCLQIRNREASFAKPWRIGKAKEGRKDMITGIHHIAIICSNYEVSKHFYTEKLGFKVIREVYRKERDSHKLDLEINGLYQIELFSFPSPPPRTSRPEAAGLRHIAFAVDDLDAMIHKLNQQNITSEPIRIDEFTGKRFTFIADPDDLPIEFYEK